MSGGGGPVLIAYDGSETAQRAIARAGKLLGSGREAIVLTVSAFPPPLLGASGSALSEIEHEYQRESARIAGEGAELARAAGFDANAEAESATPAWQRIVDRAESVDASLVVLGSRGLSGLKYALLGSVAAAVTQHTERAVLIVH